MELSEAKEILKQDWAVYDWVDEEDIEAIDTVLKALHEDEIIIDRVKNIKDRLAYDITYNWDNARDDLRRILGG